MPRVTGWAIALTPLVVAGGCKVDDREVICDLACEQGVERTGGAAGELGTSGGSSSSGGSKATGGSSSSGGSKATGGAKATGGSTTGGKAGGGTGAGGEASSASRGGSGGASAGGATGSGGAVTADCKAGSKALGMERWIDDFEDGELSLTMNEGRSGYWSHVRSDTSAAAAPLVVSETGNKFLRLSGSGIEATTDYPWALLKTDLKSVGTAMVLRSCVYDASFYSGIEFRARGAQVRVALEMDLNVPVSNTFGAPGACTAELEGDCYDRHNVVFNLSAGWVVYRVLWEDLEQQGYGDWHPTFDPARLVGLYFEVVPHPMTKSIPDYRIDIDDVVFVP
jgi:hypothetical protein